MKLLPGLSSSISSRMLWAWCVSDAIWFDWNFLRLPELPEKFTAFLSASIWTILCIVLGCFSFFHFDYNLYNASRSSFFFVCLCFSRESCFFASLFLVCDFGLYALMFRYESLNTLSYSTLPLRAFRFLCMCARTAPLGKGREKGNMTKKTKEKKNTRTEPNTTISILYYSKIAAS